MSIDNIFSVYGIVALTHVGMQMGFSHLHHRQQKRLREKPYFPSVGVVVPVYNEDPEILIPCIQSIIRESTIYPGKSEIIIIDDGSTNLSSIYDLFRKAEGVIIVENTVNKGKRECQKQAFDLLSGKVEVFVTVDSDTNLLPYSLQELVHPLLDPAVGAVTGHVQVTNERKNLLTRLISSRYWNAFNQERAAQSYFGVVFCCSGPFSAYRSDLIEKVKEAYITQRFLGTACTFGDDRHLTNLILKEGYKVKYAEKAGVLTTVPEKLSIYKTQQIRWSKSFIREMFWTFPNIFKHNGYFAYDYFMQLLLPFFLIAALFHVATRGVIDPTAFLSYFLVLFLIALVRVAYALLRTRKRLFLIFGLYGLLYVFVMIPIKLYAIATVRSNGWGTR